jgi:hypothetical protein
MIFEDGQTQVALMTKVKHIAISKGVHAALRSTQLGATIGGIWC